MNANNKDKIEPVNPHSATKVSGSDQKIENKQAEDKDEKNKKHRTTNIQKPGRIQ